MEKYQLTENQVETLKGLKNSNVWERALYKRLYINVSNEADLRRKIGTYKWRIFEDDGSKWDDIYHILNCSEAHELRVAKVYVNLDNNLIYIDCTDRILRTVRYILTKLIGEINEV